MERHVPDVECGLVLNVVECGLVLTLWSVD
jgi:hypothetical protein